MQLPDDLTFEGPTEGRVWRDHASDPACGERWKRQVRKGPFIEFSGFAFRSYISIAGHCLSSGWPTVSYSNQCVMRYETAERPVNLRSLNTVSDSNVAMAVAS